MNYKQTDAAVTTAQLADELDKTASALESIAATSKVASLGGSGSTGSTTLTCGGAYLEALARGMGVED